MVWGTDNFNRASLGTDWTIGSGSWDIATSTNLRNTTSSGIAGHAPSQPTTQDQVMGITMLGPNASTKVLQLRTRMNAAGTHYFAMRISNAQVSFRAAVGSGEVTLGSTYSFTRASGMAFRFETEGTGSNILLRAYVNDALVLSYTANNAVVGVNTCLNPSGTGTNQLFDDYLGGDLSSKPGTAQQYQVSGTVPVVVGVTGAATVVPPGPVTHQVSGTVAVTVGASGAVTRVPIIHQVSGTVAVTTGASGAATVGGGAVIQRDVFDNTPAETYTAYNDGQAGLWTANQFYTYGAPAYTGWTLLGVRIYIPAGAPPGILSTPGKVAWARDDIDYWSTDTAAKDAIDRLSEVGNQQAFSTLVTGWNDILFATPLPWLHARGVFVGISWNTGGYYVHAFPAGPDVFLARDGTRLARAEHTTPPPDGLVRGVHNAGIAGAWSTAAYGLDILLGEPVGGGGPTQHPVSGTVAVTTGATGNVTVVPPAPVTHQVSGSVAVVSAVSGAITSRQRISGTVAVTTAASGTLYESTGDLTQETMPSIEEAWVLAPAPTYTMTASSTVTGTLVLPTDSRIKPTGFASEGHLLAAATSGYWRGPYASDKGTAGTGTDPWIMPTWGMRFTTNAPVIEFKMQQRPELPVTSAISTRMMVRTIVNGQWTSRRPVYLGYTDIGYDGFESPEYITIGDDFWLKLDFGSAADRTIEFQMMTECGGVKIPSGYTMVAAPDPQHTMAWLGDSINGAERHGTGNFALSSPEGISSRATYANLSSLAHYAGQSIGYDNTIIAAVGSTGFTRPGDSVSYETIARLDNDVIAYDPHVVVIGTAFNDLQAGTSTALVNSSCDFILQRLRAALPDAILVILACPTPPILGTESAGSTTVTPYNNALKLSASDNGAWVIDPNTGDLYNPTGAVVYNGPNMIFGTAEGLDMIASDDQHPSQAGADYFGLYISEYLRLVHPVGVPVPKSVSGTVAVTTDVSGAVTQRLSVSGSVPVVVGVSGTVSQRHQVSGSVAVATTVAGDATRISGAVQYQVAGTVPVLTGAAGAVSARLPVSGIVPVLTAASGDVTRVPFVHQVSGTVAVTTTVSGGISATLRVAGSVPVVVTASGAIGSQALSVSGTVPVVTVASGDIAKRSPVAGTVAVLTAASGAVSSRLPVSGVVPVVVNAIGSPSSKQNVSGTVVVVTTASGNALPPGGMSGVVPVTVGVVGAVTSRQGLAGMPVNVTTGVSGAVTSRQQIVGVAAVTVGVSGSVQINPRGRVDVVIGVSGAVTQVHQVSGRVDVTTGAIGSLAGGSAISGVVAVGTTVSGNVTVGRSVSGAVVVTTAASGAATIAIRQSQVSGRVDVQTGAGGSLGAAFWVSGTVVVRTDVSGRATPPFVEVVPPFIPLVPFGPDLPLHGSIPALSLEAEGYPVTNDAARLTLKGTR